MHLDHYRVPPDERVRLSDWATDDDGGLSKEEGEALLPGLQERLADLQERLYAEGQQALLIVLQARDAGGKDGTVKKVIGALNPNGVQVSNFKVPTEEERAHDFLWRIHRQAPRFGMVGVFNRSQYEDVLVTRVHHLIDDRTAQHRLKHICAFESLLTDSGTRIVKFYLHISPQEQKERLEARLEDPSKHWKFNPGDLEERAHWDAYTAAYEDALTTSTALAPWYVIPADRKWFRNLLVSQILVETLEEMNPQYPTPAFNAADIKIE
ncbi:polyphosphate kinase 2 family protein [Deinococcus metallilatus]|uniref:PPK2 family polyphosphate:nucleotide phosphotransferase n=1 Tax=Deinococcus metallilatus TaxID=1211322 RepID=A0AAJ5JXB9_9DEIO|nr:polyphosphate kinase 2 family protein [Deinococcus metallilatus]MBB5297349.1 PPK2 family polyphosphate:nucleotide phosphotransferase [Deinococcus metallilatus]QBY10126.1 polyphosphate kinase 2 family protein [Deinococcus metallilatus]RXJ08286.1 polyphosphate kinase 2 family protein [Deinococcus metallilatus]TLK21193.1 polyphosphate kinase 2 family protein [Deinococcus metallilatus]